MKTCRVCGALVDDREWNCPECGATMITSSGGMTLRIEEPVAKKKVGPSIGTTVSTGSGLTDILRRDDDDYVDDNPVIVGSMPTSFNQNLAAEEEQRRKAKANRQLISSIFKIIFVLLLAVGVYFFVTKVIISEKGAESYDEVVDMYMRAVNDGDAELMELIMPEFYSYREDKAQELIDEMDGVKFDSYTIKNAELVTLSHISILTDEIKLETGKNPNLDEGYYLEVEFVGTNKAGLEIKASATMEVYRVKHYWYFYTETYENRAFSD